MQRTLALILLCVSVPAYAQSTFSNSGKSFHVAPPKRSVPSARRHAAQRIAKAEKWYHEHYGDAPISEKDLQKVPAPTPTPTPTATPVKK